MANNHYDFFRVWRAGDCCGSRIIDHWTMTDRLRNVWDAEGKHIIRADPIKFSEEKILSDLKKVMDDHYVACFFYVQLTTMQSKYIEPILYKFGFQKIASGYNRNTGHTLNTYFYNNNSREAPDSMYDKVNKNGSGKS